MNGRFVALLLFALTAAGFAPHVAAQTQLPSVVQLPSFRTFFYSGTVVVPDSGAAYLGGNRTAASGSSGRGIGGGRGFGAAFSNPQASVRATIIDNHVIDRHLLGETPQQRLGRGAAKTLDGKALDPSEEGKALVRFARKQYREGKKTASFDTYRMAIDVLQGRLRELATVEFRRLFGTAADQSLRMAARRR